MERTVCAVGFPSACKSSGRVGVGREEASGGLAAAMAQNGQFDLMVEGGSVVEMEEALSGIEEEQGAAS